MPNRARFLLVAAIGLALAGGPGLAAADPDDEVPQPGQVRAEATCAHGTAAIDVTLDDEVSSRQVRLDRVSPDVASLTKATVPHPDQEDVQQAVFEPVPAGQYLVHVDRRGDIPPADVPVVVKPCDDLQPTDEPLRVEVECQAGWGLVTFVVANPNTKGVAEYRLTTTFTPPRKVPVGEGMFIQITENGVDDLTYKARLRGPGVDVVKDFAVSCAEGNAAKVTVTAACAGTTGTGTVVVLNPNRVPVSYEVSLKDVTKKLTVKGGEKGTVTFPDIATGEHPVIVRGDDQTQASGVAKLDCAGPTTTTTTTTPVPQGRSDSGLANTGASVGALVGLAALGIGLGGALLMIGRRRAHEN